MHGKSDIVAVVVAAHKAGESIFVSTTDGQNMLTKLLEHLPRESIEVRLDGVFIRAATPLEEAQHGT